MSQLKYNYSAKEGRGLMDTGETKVNRTQEEPVGGLVFKWEDPRISVEVVTCREEVARIS